MSAPGAAIRRAGAGDAAALAAFAERAFLESYGPLNAADDVREHVARHYGPARQAAELAAPGAHCLLAVEDGAIVGYALLAAGSGHAALAGGTPCEIRRFYVDGRHHGRGVAAALMDAAVDAARGAGCTTLWLTTWEHSLRARAFYAKHGFQDVGTSTFLLGATPQTDRLLVRPLE